jgi:hypothetical protein
MVYAAVRADFRYLTGSVQTHSADGAVVTEAVLGLSSMIAREHYRDVVFI